jgi:hypothetical protein
MIEGGTSRGARSIMASSPAPRRPMTSNNSPRAPKLLSAAIGCGVVTAVSMAAGGSSARTTTGGSALVVGSATTGASPATIGA